MSNRNDIEQYRKKKQRKKRLYQALLLLGVLAIGAIVFFVVQDISKSNSYDQEESPQFPVNLKGETPVDLNVTQDSLVVTTEGSVNFYSTMARKQNSFIHGYSKPVTRTAGGYAVTYDQGGYGIRVDTKNENLGTIKLDNPILFCEINEKGQVAVACGDQKYTSGVHIYESNLKKPICSYYMNEYVMAVAFSGNNECVIASQTVSEGVFHTVLYGIDFHQDEELFRTEIDDLLTLSLGYKSSNRLTLVGSHEVVFMEKDGEQLGRYDYSNELVSFNNSESGYFVIAVGNTADPNKTDLMVFDTEGKLAAQTVISGIVYDIFCEGQNIYVLDKEHAYQFTSKLEEKNKFENNGGYHYLTVLNGDVYALGSDRLVRLS